MSFLSTPIKAAVNTLTQQLDTPFFVYDLDKLNAHLTRLVAQTELAGACFSPDGSTLFVNVYSPIRFLRLFNA